MIDRDFHSHYETSPTVAVRAPGRVNLIGEHTDYSLLPVMPIAIEQGVDVAAAPIDEPVIRADSLTLPDPVELSGPVRPDGQRGWHRYLAAAVGALGVVDRGASILVGGDLPATGGLSSSSAFTVGIVAALSEVWGLGLTKDQFPDIALAAERSIGIEGGMMDQTVISLARRGHAARIDFDPLEIVHVPIPDGLRLVAAYSGATALKGAEARDSYNSKVVAGRCAAALLLAAAGIDTEGELVLGRVAATPDVVAAAETLPTISAAAVSNRCSIDVDRLTTLGTGRLDDQLPLPLADVAVHVLTEATRVDRAEAALRDGDLAGFGRLLTASHVSLRRFGASSPRLDDLVAATEDAGALGARLTGAGFGGYAVAATSPGALGDVIEAAIRATGGPAFEVTAGEGVRSTASGAG